MGVGTNSTLANTSESASAMRKEGNSRLASSPTPSFQSQQHFHQHGGIDHGIIRSFRKLKRAADDGQIGIRAKSCRYDFDSQVGVVWHIVTVKQPITEFASQIGGNEAMLWRTSCHREYLTIEELALELSGAFDLQIFRLG